MNRPLTGENWRPIPGHVGYEASDQGRIRSVDRTIYWPGGHRHAAGRVLKPVYDRKGYHRVQLGVGNGRAVHQLVLEAFVGPRPSGYETLHANDKRDDNRLSNLRWGTASENVREAVQRGRHSRAALTHCPRKHLLQHPNLRADCLRNGSRGCRACHEARTHLAKMFRAHGLKLDLREAADARYARLMQGWSHAA